MHVDGSDRMMKFYSEYLHKKTNWARIGLLGGHKNRRQRDNNVGCWVDHRMMKVRSQPVSTLAILDNRPTPATTTLSTTTTTTPRNSIPPSPECIPHSDVPSCTAIDTSVSQVQGKTMVI